MSYVIPIFAGLLAAMTLAKDWGAHQTSWRRTGVGLLIIGLMIASVANTYQTGKHNDQRRREDEAKINKLQASVDAANTAQADNTKQFLQQFSDLSGKVAKLQTEAATEALQKQAKDLQAQLQTTQQALHPPKATLEFSFRPGEDKPIHSVSLPRDPSGDVTVQFTMMNFASANALDGFIMLQICDQCSFVKEPDKFKKIAGQRETQRNYDFDRIMPMQSLPDFEFTMHVPPSLSNATVGVNYRCTTCIVPNLVNQGFPESLRGIIYFVPNDKK